MKTALTRAEIGERVAKLSSAWPGYDVVRDCMAAWPDAGFYLIGGSVRNVVLGLPETKDMDVLIDASTMEPLKAGLAGHGLLKVGPFGNFAWYPHPGERWCWEFQLVCRMTTGVWQCEDIGDVCNGVDSTSNAIAYDMRTGEIIDPQNGIRDMNRRILRGVRFDRREEFICDDQIPYPATVWFRNLHYATTLGLEIEPVTKGWIREKRHYKQYLDFFSSTFFVPKIDPRLYPEEG
ncbi:hypothetical protein OV208_07335 [Corallococcus sp. bb12-1]|uniref:hypothetical protein n=1 Tax=Corallococcus sp. bb12-1 TaxID=2996784 RepID=UPI00226DF97A|nr:hypothetical protein [Corallococcus sp. bb12-1]MCY1041127.1 hypothetical protein [Corallococcus sp. bb12-1]